jgi:hypothetical protein
MQHPKIKIVYTPCFGLIDHLQESKLVLQVGSQKATAIAVKIAAMHMFSFAVFLIVSYSGVWQF